MERNKKKKEDKTCEEMKVVCQIEKSCEKTDFILRQERNIGQAIMKNRWEIN